MTDEQRSTKYVSPTYSPAPIPEPEPNSSPSVISNYEQMRGAEEHEYLISLDERGSAVFATKKLQGILDNVQINQTMPSRIIIQSERNPELIIYNNHIRLFEKACIRFRTQDPNGRYLNDSTCFVINEKLKVMIQGSPLQNVKMTIMVRSTQNADGSNN